MNIFMLTSVPVVPPWDQGDKNLAYGLAQALPQHRFRILTTQDQAQPDGQNLDPEPVYRRRHPSLAEKANVYWRLLSAPKRASDHAPTPHRPDLYHLVYQPYPLSSRLSRLLPEFRRRPTLHTVPATASGQVLERDLFFADRVVTISEYGRATLRQMGVHNVTHIPPGIEVGRWQSLEGQAERLKARLGLSGKPVILFPGHYGPGQGSEVMLSALPGLVDGIPEVRVVLACRPRSTDDRERERAFRQAVESLGLAEHVRFYHVVADMESLIGASDLVVLPLQTMKDKVDLPMTLLESMAAGKPIVISDLAPMNELIAGSYGHAAATDTGLMVPPGDAPALVEAITALLTDHSLRRQMGENGQALVRTYFDIEQVASQYEHVYEEMVS